MNEQQYNKLNTTTLKYILTCAYKGNYLVGVSDYNAKIIFGVYNEISNTPEHNTRCALCVFDVCYKVGEWFFKYQEEREQAENNVEDSALDNITKKEATQKSERKDNNVEPQPTSTSTKTKKNEKARKNKDPRNTRKK